MSRPQKSMLIAPMSSSPPVISPVVHAIGGSLGSALSLLIFYPLERTRIELQSQAARQRRPRTDVSGRGDSPIKSLIKEGSNAPNEECDDDDSSWVSARWSNDCNATALSTSLDDDDEDEELTMAQCLRGLLERNELYRGVGPIVTTLAASNFVFFFVNAWMKSTILSATKTVGKNGLQHWALFASCLAGVCNVLLTNPLWVANLRIVTGEAKSSSLIKEMRHVAEEDGIAQLWKGTGTSLMLVSNPVIQFFAYDQLKRARLSKHSILPPLEAFLAGALSKAIATVLTYPLQLAQAVLRLQHRPHEGDAPTAAATTEPYRSTFDCLWQLYQRKGLPGLFTGMRAKLLQTVLTAAFTFLTYEQILTAVAKAHLALAAAKS